jgi:DNA-binding transcriptional ArsR family regulator
MTLAKINSFEENLVRVSRIAKAFAHPARLHILRILSERNECVCGEIVDASPLAQSTVSQHLKELKKEGLIEGEVEGPKTCYCLNRDAISEAESVISRFFRTFEKPKKSLINRENKE